jgi:benzodiazapine receptor
LLALVGFVGFCLLVGAADAAAIAGSVRSWYLTLIPPPFTPPNWVFGPVWTVLYVLIGVAAWLIWRVPALGQRRALVTWGWQLLLNAAWPPVFFGLHSPALGLCVMLPQLVLIGLTVRRFAAIRPLAAWLMLPYAAWTCYATYLDLGFLWLNPG